MKPSISVKPEPRKAQSNWSYQAYFLSQRQAHETIADNVSTTSISGFDNRPALEAEHRHQVIAKREALAASIGVHITIVNQASAL
jgi:hypothetical protein